MSVPKIVECVPNFSEGRDPSVIEAIAGAIRSTPGAFLLGVDPGADANRTVYTIAGEAEAALGAALAAARVAFARIDMSRHRGVHPRLGALDVCPFVPLSGASIADCAALARRFGEALASELGVPVYLYEKAATRPERSSLAAIRAGEYEGLPEKLARPEWRPDFGPPSFMPRWGATVAGAREFLIAYNANLDTRDAAVARDIAGSVRESGCAARDAQGHRLCDAEGRVLRRPGLLKSIRAIGWYMEAYGCAQVSMNLLDYRATPIHAAYETVKAEAEKRGLRPAGSEIVGLAPLAALLDAGRFYSAAAPEEPPEAELVGAAIRALGLDSVSAFDPERKIVEYALRRSGLA